MIGFRKRGILHPAANTLVGARSVRPLREYLIRGAEVAWNIPYHSVALGNSDENREKS